MSPSPAPGTGRGQLVDQIQLRLGVLRGMSEYLERLTAPDGALICPRHRIEHTGKVVYGAIVNLHLWRYSREEDFLARARRQVLRAVDHLGEDPESKVPVFLPGRCDPRNASTNSIDGGACADVIATLLEEVPELFDANEQARCREAIELHVEQYLRHSARARDIPAQRLWAGTGVARAARLLQRDDWRADALAGCALALRQLHADGIAPYIPADAADCSHPGLADVSTFYHSRTPAFVLYIHQVLDEPFDDEARQRLRASLDALVALRDGRGRKVIHNEAKAWYWESDYEVASHPFDAYALHTGSKLLEAPVYANEAGRVMVEWIAHIDAMDGGVRSHHGRGRNFQCRVFWTGHAAWVARIMDDVSLRYERRERTDVDLPVSGVLHVERPRYTAVLRGRKAPAGNLFGCDVGGGSLQSLVVHGEASAPAERIPLQRHVRGREGSFLVRPRGSPGRLARWRAVLRSDRSDLRFRLYVASVEWKARAWLFALLYPLRTVLLRSWRAASPWCASHLDLQTEQVYDGDAVRFSGGVADRDGTRVPGAHTERHYRFLADRVALRDVLRLTGVSGSVRYVLPRALQDVTVRCEGAPLRRRGRRLSARAAGGPLTLSTEGHWPA